MFFLRLQCLEYFFVPVDRDLQKCVERMVEDGVEEGDKQNRQGSGIYSLWQTEGIRE